MENQQFTPAPENHMVKAILTLLFCCLPFGIVSLIHATKVESLWSSGQQEQAKHEADEANKWANYALITGIVVYVVYIILYAVVGVAALSF